VKGISAAVEEELGEEEYEGGGGFSSNEADKYES
jgi:hypothetical protein